MTFSPALLLRIGLGLTFFYAGISGLISPADWVGFLPTWIGAIVSPDIALLVFSFAEIAISFWLFSGWRTKWAAGTSTFLLLGILFSSPNQLIITFRDIGLLFAALALWRLE